MNLVWLTLCREDTHTVQPLKSYKDCWFRAFNRELFEFFYLHVKRPNHEESAPFSLILVQKKKVSPTCAI
jgi:hypothetical protein